MTQSDFFESLAPATSAGPRKTGAWADEFGKILRNHTSSQFRPKTLSLFSGAGGLDIGFADAGFDIFEQVEIDPQFCQTLTENINAEQKSEEAVKILCKDIREYQPSHSSVDFVIGGPPCQSFSAAGARASGVSGTNDERGTLFLEYVRILNILAPKGFLFENVYRILGSNGGKDWKKITESFAAAGYDIVARILDTADYGVAQHRERAIVVGIRKDIAENVNFKFPRPTHGPDALTEISHITAEDVLSDIDTRKARSGLNGRYGHLLADIPPGLNYSFYTEKMNHPNPVFAWRSKFSDFLYKADPKKPVRTIKAQGGKYTGPFHWDGRPFLVSELKRLQSFPDKYVLTGNKQAQIKQIGNSVPPQFARILACSVASQLFKSDLPIDMDYLFERETLSFRKRKRMLSKHYKELAQKSLSTGKVTRKTAIKLKSYNSDLSESMDWHRSKYGIHEVVETVDQKVLKIAVDSHESPRWITTIAPTNSWALPYDQIIVDTSAKSGLGITSGWKALEHFLIRNGLKADLVQLSGYYQYPCNFRCEVDYLGKDDFLIFLKRLTEGEGINVLISQEIATKIFNLREDQLSEYFTHLKEIGFEVRNQNTNPSIPLGHHLIPYSFPTLTSQSVQLSKQLQ